MSKPLRFAVIGLGMGGHHCTAITNARGAELGGVCDIDPVRLTDHARKFGCKAYARYADVLRDPSIDAVSIVTESGKHTEMGVQAAKAGKHIIVEKPIDILPQRITKFQEAVKKAGVKCGCIFQSRMDNCNILLKRAIDRGRIGRLIGVHASLPWFRADSYYEGPHGSWKGTWSMDGGGSLMNQGIHTLDLIIFLAGPIESVSGFYGVFNHTIEAEDQTVAILRFENGALGTLSTTTCCIPDGAQRLHVYGSKGSFYKTGSAIEQYEAGPAKERERLLNLFGGKGKKSKLGSDPMAVSADGHMLIVEDLVKAVRSNREPAIPLESARHAVDVACAIYKSGRTGKAARVASVRK